MPLKKKRLESRASSRLSLATVRVIRARYKVIRQQLGAVTPKAIVDDARNPRSPLHKFFEWDNDSAAEAYRLFQARNLICQVQVYITRDGVRQPVRVYASVVKDDVRQYEELTEVLSNPVSKRSFMEQMRRDLEGVMRRYKTYEFCAKAIHLLERAIDTLD